MAQNLGIERSRFDGVVFDYSLLTPMNGLDGAAYSGVLGLDVMGGSLALGLESQTGLASNAAHARVVDRRLAAESRG